MADIKKIWKFLKNNGMTDAGTAGMMGNLKAESNLEPVCLEILCKQRYRERQGKIYTDATYAAFVDDGTISKAEFLRPMGLQYAWGLAQWTSPSRKEGLYDLCKKRKVSIGDLEAQLDYLVMELKNSYQSVWKVLTTTNDIRLASDTVLMKFEIPADQGQAVQNLRCSYSTDIYNEMVGTKTSDKTSDKTANKVSTSKVTADDVLKVMTGWIGYSEANGKYRQIINIYNKYGAEHGYPRGYRAQYSDEWCDMTVSAAFIKANAIDLIGGAECGVEEHIKIFKNKGIWIEDGTVTPKRGYIICYNWDDWTQPNNGYADHIGMVETVSGSEMTVIEGNCDEVVKRRSIPVGWGYIRGYAAPKYGTAKQTESTSKPVESTNKTQTESTNKTQTASTSGGLNKTEKWVGKCIADILNVRSWAGTEFPNIRTWPYLAYGNLCSVCDTVKAADGSDWYYIYIEAGKCYGFVCAEYIERV